MDASYYRYFGVNNDPTRSTYHLSEYTQFGAQFMTRCDLEYPGLVSSNRDDDRYFVSAFETEQAYQKAYGMEV